MELLQDVLVDCPYCGEPIALLVDASVEAQSYTEDCQVCCQPIVVDAFTEPGGFPSARVRREDETG